MKTRRILLIQVRDPDDPMALHEAGCVARRLEPRPIGLTIRNALAITPEVSWLRDTDAVILGGSGDYSVHDTRSRRFVNPLRRLLDALLERATPVFGICFGHQLLGYHFGGEVVTDPVATEIGTIRVELTAEGASDPLFGQFAPRFFAHTGHSDRVTSTPPELIRLAQSDSVDTQAFKVRGAPVYTAQFHPDLSGSEALERYLHYQSGFAARPDPRAARRFRQGCDRATALLGRFVDLALWRPASAA